jgi:3-dehydroquinate synthase
LQLIWDFQVSASSEFSIKTSTGSYRVRIGSNLIDPCTVGNDVAWVIDANVARLHASVMPPSFISQEATESAKNLESVTRLLEQLRDLGGTRHTHMMAAGGGIVQDLATFSASCYMRGIRWTYLPTTMLSMVDSCIGGKSSLNVGRYKNIAGNFYPPEEVVIDTRFCDTLTDEQMAEGLCEAAKICYAESDTTFADYLSLAESQPMPPRGEQLAKLIRHSLWTKKRFIEEDEFDQGIRLLLNFGHTFGHAIEGATSYAISHGMAVGLGMLAAAHCSVRLGHVSNDLANVSSLTHHIRRLLRSAPHLSTSLQKMRPEDAMECFLSDKKHSADFFTLILFDQKGRLQRVKLPRSDATQRELLLTFQHLSEQAYEIQ